MSPFLAEMDAVIPWTRLVAPIEPHYPKAGGGRPPHDLERMLRIYFQQQWFDLSDPGAEDAIYDSESMRRFVGVELGEDSVPDETPILRFRHLLEEHELAQAMFAEIRERLEEQPVPLSEANEETRTCGTVLRDLFCTCQRSQRIPIAALTFSCPTSPNAARWR